jgi:hypothetical protein
VLAAILERLLEPLTLIQDVRTLVAEMDSGRDPRLDRCSVSGEGLVLSIGSSARPRETMTMGSRNVIAGRNR